ncbi:hypothetical protein HAX54_016266 [Datura stramonium]|uniref:Uncharacterized protein n=1 Tax=Datura stramonium TaxID=4076 RepID=A0ABS8S0I7_DATST|nr:hypothetical protein [Datura stramonium]
MEFEHSTAAAILSIESADISDAIVTSSKLDFDLDNNKRDMTANLDLQLLVVTGDTQELVSDIVPFDTWMDMSLKCEKSGIASSFFNEMPDNTGLVLDNAAVVFDNGLQLNLHVLHQYQCLEFGVNPMRKVVVIERDITGLCCVGLNSQPDHNVFILEQHAAALGFDFGQSKADYVLAAVITPPPLSIRVTYGVYIVACSVKGAFLKVTVLHDEMVVQGIKSNIVLRTNLIHEFCNEYTSLEAGTFLGAGRIWLEVRPCSYSSTAFVVYIKFPILPFHPGILNIHITDGINTTMCTNIRIPATYDLIATLRREQFGVPVMKDVGTDAFESFGKTAKSSDPIFALSETIMFDPHKSNGPPSDVLKKYIVMFFEISENREEHNNLYEAFSKNIQLGILLTTNSLALSPEVLAHPKMDLVAKLALAYLTVDVFPHVLIYAYTTILVFVTEIKYSFQKIERMQEYLKDPIKLTAITVVPVDAFYDPYGDQTWRKPLETIDAEEEAKQDSTINNKDVLTHHAPCDVYQYECHIRKAEIFLEHYSRTWNHLSSFKYTYNWWHVALSYLEKTWVQLSCHLADAFL